MKAELLLKGEEWCLRGLRQSGLAFNTQCLVLKLCNKGLKIHYGYRILRKIARKIQNWEGSYPTDQPVSRSGALLFDQ